MTPQRALPLASDPTIILYRESCTGPFLSMFAGSSCTILDPFRCLNRIMSKRKLTRSCSVGGSPSCYAPKSPSTRIDQFYKTTKAASPRSAKAPRKSTTVAGSPDIRKYLSPSADRTAKKSRLVPKRRVNLTQVFEHVVCHVEKRPLESSDSDPPAKLCKIEGDDELLVREEESTVVKSLISNRIDPPSPSDPDLPPPPCIKRRWKTVNSRGQGVKLFGSSPIDQLPRTDNAIAIACRKLVFGSPSSLEIRTIS